MTGTLPPRANLIDATTEFTRLADLPEGVWLGGGTEPLVDLRALRRRLLAEEVNEYLDGEDRDDPTEIADGLADVMVIAWGTLLAYFGEDAAAEICREVWSTNLAKVDGSLGEICRRDDGKLLKPEGWTPPNIRSVLVKYGFVSDRNYT